MQDGTNEYQGRRPNQVRFALRMSTIFTFPLVIGFGVVIWKAFFG